MGVYDTFVGGMRRKSLQPTKGNGCRSMLFFLLLYHRNSRPPMIKNRPRTPPTTAPIMVSGGTGRFGGFCSDIPPDTEQDESSAHKDVGVGAVVRLSVTAVKVGEAVIDVAVE